MTAQEHHSELLSEMSALEQTAQMLELLRYEYENGTFTERDVYAAAMAFQNLYTGIENIFKRICKYQNIPLPTHENWHISIMKLFSETSETRKYASLPILVPAAFVRPMTFLRKLRHTIMHGYGFRLEAERIGASLQEIPALWQSFRQEAAKYNTTLSE
jgi:hypothetical protein